MRKKQDINNLAEFEKWIDKTFGFVFADVKKFMEKSWCARGKYDRLKNKGLLNMTPLEKEKQYIDLQISITEAKALLKRLSGQEVDRKDYKRVIEKIAWYVCE